MDNSGTGNQLAPPPGFSYDDGSTTGTQQQGTAAPSVTAPPAQPAPPPGFSYDAEPTAPAPKLTRPSAGDYLKNFGSNALQSVGAAASGLGRLADKVGDASGMSNVTTPAIIAANELLPKAMQASPQTLTHPETTLGGAIGGAITGLGDKLQASQSEAFKQEAAKPLFEGSLYQGSLMHPSTLAPGTLKFGAGLKSPAAIAANLSGLAGQAVPLLAGGIELKGADAAEQLGAKVLPGVLDNAPAIVQKGAAAISKLANPQTLKTMGIGAAQFGEQAGAQEQQRIESMTPEQLQAVPAYQQMVARGMSPADAQKTLAEQVHDQVFNKVAPLGALAGVTSALPLLEGGQGVLAKAVGASRLKRAALGAALEAPTQGAMNVSMGAAQTAAANQVTGENRDPMENSGSEAVTGGLMGLGFGAAGSLRAHAEVPARANADAAGVPPLPTAAPGSLTEVAQQIGGLRPNDAAAQAAGAPPLPGAPKPAASPNSQANLVPPEAPAWMNPETGELGTPSRDDLVTQLASHMVQQHQATGDMRVNQQQLADAWGVSKSDIDKSRSAAVRNASDQIAAAERAAMNPQPDAALNEPSGDTGQLPAADTADASTKASVPFMITQAMRSELRALGHTDSDISGMTPAQAHATLKEGERVLGPARDLLGSSTEPAADAAVKETQAAQDAADAAAKEKAAPDETLAPDNTPAPEAAQLEISQPEASAEPAKAADAAPAADQPPEAKTPEQATPDTTNAAAQEPANGATKPDSLPKESASVPAADVAAADGSSGSGGAGEGSGGAPAQAPEEKAAAPRAGEPAPVAEPAPAAAKADKAPFKVANAIRDAEAVRIKTPDGEVNGRTHVDQLIKNGYTKVESIRAGDKMVHRMVNAAGEREPIKARQLKYAKEATEKRAQEATQQIDAAAHEAATSPTNERPEPTPAQIEAGNYKKGHVDIHGMDVSIENPRGSTRSGVGEDGKPWSHEMSDHYGYVKGTVGADGEHVDAYIGAHPESKRVFVVDQIDQKTGKFDEHKAMIGFKSKRDAIQAYKSNFDPGWKVGPVKDLTVDAFKTWLKEGDTTKPLAAQAVASRAAETNAVASQKPVSGGDKAPARALFSKGAPEDNEPFYSALTRSVAAGKGAPKTADASMWKQWMDGAQRRGEFKQAEREWLGVDQWLADQKGKVSREALQQYVLDNQVQVQETELGEKAPAKFSAYQLPGGDNYRELLLTLPRSESEGAPIHDDGTLDNFALNPGKPTVVRSPEFNSNHFEQPNILAHVRFNERTDADGKKVLFLEELQSDFGQAVRKSKQSIINAVKTDFEGIVERMKKAGVLAVECD